jgi:membrane protease YdiL (CAAX protease family)
MGRIRAQFASPVSDENPYSVPLATPPPLPPLERVPWNGWWTLLWAILLFLIWQMVMTVGLVVAGIQKGAGLDGFDEEGLMTLASDGDVAGSIAFATIFFICPFCWLLGQLRPGFSGWSYLGNVRVTWWHWPLWGVATIACSVIFGMLAPFFGVDGPDESMVALGQSTELPLLLYLGVGVGAPLVEEFVFRGLLWRGWRASKLGLAGTLGLTSFLWAILHVQYPTVIICYIFVLGLVLGWAREASGNIWVPVGMHALNNGLATLHMLSL